MSDEVWITLADVKKIFNQEDTEHLVVARYHGSMLADSVRVVDQIEEIVSDSRGRLWRLTPIREGELIKFIRVLAKLEMITVYEDL
jgi:hypothetical protein